MDTDDTEDMLFGLSASPEELDDATSDVSDDDILDEVDIDELTLWDEADSPLLMPTYNNAEVDLTTSSQQLTPEVLSTADAMRPYRDR